jgi:predicted ATPase
MRKREREARQSWDDSGWKDDDSVPRYVLTGAPGTGKTSVLSLLSKHHATVSEPARDVIAEHNAATGERTLDHRPDLFVEKLIERSVQNYEAVADLPTTFFDRGLPDCVTYAEIYGLDPEPVMKLARRYRYETPVFVTRPWRQIYTTDELRKATFEQVERFHTSLVGVYTRLGYDLIELPEVSPADRAAFIRETVSQASGG